jgi:hypothetical protein
MRLNSIRLRCKSPYLHLPISCCHIRKVQICTNMRIGTNTHNLLPLKPNLINIIKILKKLKKSDEAGTPTETERISQSNANHNPTSSLKATPTTTYCFPPTTNHHPRKPDLDSEWSGFCKILGLYAILSPNQNKTQNIKSQNSLLLVQKPPEA